MGAGQVRLQSDTKPANFILVVKMNGCGACIRLEESLKQLNAQGVDISHVVFIDKDRLHEYTKYVPMVQEATKRLKGQMGYPMVMRIKNRRLKNVELGAPSDLSSLLKFIRV